MIHRPCVMVGVMLVLAGRVLADASPPSEKPGNSCHDAHSWREWEALVARHPESYALHAFYAVRLGLYLQVDRQAWTVDQATVIFESARQALLTQLQDQRPRGKRSADR